MSVLVEIEPVVKKRDDAAVKIDRRIYRQAKQVATRRGIKLNEYLSEKLAGPVAQDFNMAAKDMAAEAKAVAKDKSKDALDE